MADADGFVGVGGDLGPRDAPLRAYAEGVFPWFNEDDPILWWSPAPAGRDRPLLDARRSPHGGMHIARRLARTIRSGKFRVTYNLCFERVMEACGEKREGGTWVTPDMLAAYTEMHRLGHAHSVETWFDGELAGGVYGLAVGGLFAAESMFFRVSDGSKVALAALVSRLAETPLHIARCADDDIAHRAAGGGEHPRAEYLGPAP